MTARGFGSFRFGGSAFQGRFSTGRFPTGRQSFPRTRSPGELASSHASRYFAGSSGSRWRRTRIGSSFNILLELANFRRRQLTATADLQPAIYDSPYRRALESLYLVAEPRKHPANLAIASLGELNLQHGPLESLLEYAYPSRLGPLAVEEHARLELLHIGVLDHALNFDDVRFGHFVARVRQLLG